MTRFHTGFRIVTAILSLFAVVFSVFEHEGLVLSEKEPLLSSVATFDRQAASEFGAESILAPTERESVDDCYRKELQNIRVAPGSRQKPVRPLLRGLPSRRPLAWRMTRVVPRGRPRLVGVVELRL